MHIDADNIHIKQQQMQPNVGKAPTLFSWQWLAWFLQVGPFFSVHAWSVSEHNSGAKPSSTRKWCPNERKQGTTELPYTYSSCKWISAFLDSYSSYTKHGLPPEAACMSCICSQHARDCDTTRTANSAAAQWLKWRDTSRKRKKIMIIRMLHNQYSLLCLPTAWRRFPQAYILLYSGR